MKSIKLWNIGSKNGHVVADPCEALDNTESEKQLEDLLVASPDLLEEGLTLVGRQTPSPGGPLDLLGVDSDGWSWSIDNPDLLCRS